MSGFYIDVDKCLRLGLIQRVSVRLNGKKVNKVIAAKSGKNGFVKFYDENFRLNRDGESIVEHKLRGNVKVSIAHELVKDS